MALAVFFNRPSRSGVRLAKALGADVLKSFPSLIDYISKNKGATVLNWGVGIREEWNRVWSIPNKIRWIGDPHCISAYIDKSSFNHHYKNFVAQSYTVGNFIPSPEAVYVGRKTMTGSGGKGIFFFRKNGDNVEVYDFDEKSFETIALADFRQYVRFAKAINKYVPKTNEYRFFVGSDRIIGYIEKRKGKTVNTENSAPDLPMADYLRNHTNGYVFCKQGIEERNPSFDNVKKFVETKLIPIAYCHNMWIVAFDLGYDKTTGKICVYEGNTAPGLLSDTTMDDVVKYLKETHLKHIFNETKETKVEKENKAFIAKPVFTIDQLCAEICIEDIFESGAEPG